MVGGGGENKDSVRQRGKENKDSIGGERIDSVRQRGRE